MMYEEGLGGLPRNDAIAARYYLRSAQKGFPEAQFAIGLSYEFAEGVPKSAHCRLLGCTKPRRRETAARADSATGLAVRRRRRSAQ